MNQNNDTDPKIKEVFSNASTRRRDIDVENIKNTQFKTITENRSFAAKIMWLAAIILIIYLTYASTNLPEGDFNKAGASDISIFEELQPQQPRENKSAGPPEFMYLLAAFLLEGLALFYIIKFMDNIFTSISARLSPDRFKINNLMC